MLMYNKPSVSRNLFAYAVNALHHITKVCVAAATCSRPTPQQLTKYMPLYYRQAAGHRKGDNDTELEDKLQELQQQTLTMHTEWQQQQAAAHTCKLPSA